MISCPIDALVASTLLMIAVLLLREPVRRLFGPTVAYALWALPALRMLLPPLPESVREATGSTPITQATEVIYRAVSAPEIAPAPDYTTYAVALWAAVAGAFLLYHLAQYFRFRARLLRRHEPLDRIGDVRVVLSPAAPGPLAFGIVSRYVALPADLDARYDREEQALALAHELGHHARGDLLANWAALAVLALHWWNPVAWIAHRAFRADQELANDARVLRERGPETAHAYACALLKTAHGGAIAAACHLHSVKHLKGRLRMLKARPASPRRLLAGVAAVTALAATGLGLTASGAAATAAVKAGVGETIGVDLDRELDIAFADLSAAGDDIEFAQADLPAPRSQLDPLPSTAPPPPPVALSAPVPPAPPVTPPPGVVPVPRVPLVPPVPAAPPVPPAPTWDGDRHVTVVRTKDGRVTRHVIHHVDGRHIDPSSLPEIRERRCGGGERPVVRHEERGGKRLTIICTDRIERAAERAAETAAQGRNIERDALRSALNGLQAARSSIADNVHLTVDQRRQALAGVERGIREVERDLARVD